MFNKDEMVAQNQLHKTNDYIQFKILPGNRNLDKVHVKMLAKRIKEDNLLPYFPIIVNERMEVIDGQHRLRAAEEIKVPIYYEIKEGLNIESVRQLNTGSKNWTWLDFTRSYSDLGNNNYTQLLDLLSTYKQKFAILYVYSTGRHTRGNSHGFYDGNFVMKDYDFTKKLMRQYVELSEAAQISTRDFAFAVYRFMRSPNYNHEKMVEKVEKFGEPLHSCWFQTDFLTALEQISKV